MRRGGGNLVKYCGYGGLETDRGDTDRLGLVGGGGGGGRTRKGGGMDGERQRQR